MMNLTKEMLRGEDIDMSYFSRRRTIRNFHPEPLDDELLTTIVRQATKAPTTGNMQLYSVICTRMPETETRRAAFLSAGHQRASVAHHLCRFSSL